MAAPSKGLLEPRCTVDPRFGRVKKVFVAYVHNPDEYEAYVPPYRPEDLLDPNLLREVLHLKLEHEQEQKNKIQRHTDAVQRLCTYLSQLGVAVAYDQYWKGQHIGNLLHHFERQIADSDFVLLIITPSMNHYLQNVAPIDEEILFTDNLLYNLMTVKKPPGTNFVPIFVNSHKIIDLIPSCLASAMSYELLEPFDYQKSGMYDLYALLTNQGTVIPSPSNFVVSLPPPRSACEFK